ncbi:MAG: Calx-beta domain-containing protein [Pyrinomonadaceae bacterium]
MPLLRRSTARRLFCALFIIVSATAFAPARAADGCSTASFKLPQSYDISGGTLTFSSILYFAAADFNGDSKPDVAGADRESGTVAILFNDGAGRLGGLKVLKPGSAPTGIAAGDFNGDGRADLVVANNNSDTVSLFLGDGAGNFSAASDFAAGSKPWLVSVADLNGDGRADVIVTNSQQQKLTVLLGNGAGSLAPAPDSPFNIGAEPNTLAVADFNKDGRPDVAAASPGSGVYLLLGDGAGRLGAATLVHNSGSYNATAADFNADGKPDLVLTTFNGVTTLLGDGAGGFGVPINYDIPYYGPFTGGFNAIVAADFDGDGKTDLAGASPSPAGVIVLKGDGAGAFSSPRNFVSRSTLTLAAVDFDGDGRVDIGSVGGGLVTVLLNEGGGAFGSSPFIPSTTQQFGARPGVFATGDFNGDGKTDFAVAPTIFTVDLANSAYVSVILGDGAGGQTFMPDVRYPNGSRITSVAAADFNSDGKLDLAVLTASFFHRVNVHLGDGTGKFADPIINNVNPSGFTPLNMLVYDHNSDGKPDVVVTNQGSFNAVIMYGDGAGNLIRTKITPDVDGTPAVADFNKDGHPDLAYSNYKGSSAAVFINGGPGQIFNLGPAVELSVGSRVSTILVGDFDGDTNQDVLAVVPPFFNFDGTVNFPGGRLVFFKGNGAGGFTKGAVSETNMHPSQWAAAGDFDGDGRLDVAVSNISNEPQPVSLRVFSGDGAGGFDAGVSFDLPGYPQHLVPFDYNSDGRVDLLASIPDGREIAVLTNDLAAPRPCLSIDDTSTNEGDAGAHDVPVTVRLSSASAGEVRVNYYVRNHSAVGGSDFQPGFGTLVFAPGETARTLNASVLGDVVDEQDESLRVYLSGEVGASLSDEVGSVNITDDDQPPTLSVADVSLNEGNFSGSASLNFRVTLSGPSAKTVTVNFATSDGTATVDNDYFQRTGTLEFGAGVTSLNVTVSLRGDLIHEPDETFFLTLSQPSNATIADGQAQATILNDDAFPILTVLDGSAFESASGDTTATFTLRLSNPNSQPVTVNYATADVTASAGADYNAASGTVTFNPGETSKSVAVTIKDDPVDEDFETFNFNLSDASGATIGDAQGLGTILDNDGPALSVGDVSADEGQSGLTNFVFTVTLSAASPQAVSVRYTTVPGTAVSNTFPFDFQGVTSGFLLIPAGATSGTFTIRVVGDLLVEPDETFTINLSNPTDATVADGQALATIRNDDGPGKLQFASATFTANESEPSALVTVVRVGGATGAATVDYTASGGTATDGADYTSVSGTLSFAEGQTSKTFNVPLLNDVPAEPEETVNLTLSSPTGAPLGDVPAAVLKIGDDPRPVIQFAAAAQTANESERLVNVTIRRLGDASKPVSVRYATQDGTATERRDYNLTLGVLSFAAGETEKAVEVLLTDDAIPEGPETFTLTLTGPADSRLGDVTTTVVTLGGEDNAGAANPIDADAEFFVRQHYHDFLNREPDAPGLAFWTNEITQCGADAACREAKRVHVSAAFFLSIEFQQTGYLVYRTYKAAYGSFPGTPLTVNLRQFMPDTQGLGQGVRVGIGDWEARLEANKRAYLADFVRRAEFVGRYPASMSPEQFVDALNANVSGALSQSERDQLVLHLATGAKGRDEVLRAVAEDPDFAVAEFNRAFVLMQYYGYLRRNPNDAPDSDFSGYQFWLGKLNEFNGNFVNAEMVKAFITSDEYRRRFGQ